MVDWAGPAICVQAYVTITPSGSEEVLPCNCVLFTGNVIVMSFSVRAVGGMFPTGTAAFTVTVTLSVAVAPRLSVTVNLNTYVPCTRLYKPVVAELVLANVYPVGPLTRVHA